MFIKGIHSWIEKYRMLALEILALVVCCGVSSCHILRLPCKEIGDFNIVKENMALQNFVIATFPELTAAQCEHKCRMNHQCKSIHVEKGDKTCQLNSKSIIHLSAGENALVAKQNWIYKSTDYSETLYGENCHFFNPCKIGQVCMDTCTCTNHECLHGLKGCKEAQDKGFKASGVYKIVIDDFPTRWLPVFCDMATDGGGWIVFQRRIDNSVDFYRNWSEYKKGFGVKTGNFWLGLDNLHALAASGKGAVLRVDLKHVNDDNQVHAYYSKFEIGSEADGYRLTIDGYSGNAGDSLSYHNNMKFATFDLGHVYCASTYRGAWWFNTCHWSNLNGLFPQSQSSLPNTKYMSWSTLKGSYGGIVFSEMKLRYI